MPISEAVQSNAWVCGRSIPGIVGLIMSGVWMPVSWECCVLSDRVLYKGVDHSSRVILPSVVCLSVIVNPGQ